VGLGAFIGYVATREPRPLDDRPRQEPGWADEDGNALDMFDDVGDWEPMHQPLIKVTAVVVAISVLVGGVSTVLELVVSAH
jgi:hypothetical protein